MADGSVRGEDVAARVRRDLGGEAGLVVDRADDRDARGTAQVVVLFAESRSHVDDPGSFVCGDEVTCKHPERVRWSAKKSNIGR